MRLVVALILLFSSQVYSQNQNAQYRLAVDHLNTGAEQNQSPPGYVLDITVQNIQQLDAVLNRADKLKGQFSPDQYGRIAIVLHGLVLNMFRKKNYSRYMSIVEKARQLDQQNLVDIKACQTVMKNLQIEQSELPDFIEQVPLAPVEIDRLEREKGYTRL
ncbi:MAG: hypothetical protein HOG41_15520 [Gammaproteobacteria bacterium]|jgi:intracellular sulfur oxidation DsrE/DsrF family protein|nr:hypothetical protein [Gammaproteobacteria bacterium]MBT3724789.1 hypothetical protein [Gammaproteobacteria bacterium]MBT4075251.1 hypothetical protein [Gammaproteobacteria bacterium]MBT4449743.1 hypothetical protein [Gammaproteobacteria bacterium]MBT4859219.1 hypothetical protein [Gammaproteobacteria bacterium]